MENAIQTLNAGSQLSVEGMRSHVAVIEDMTKAVMKEGMHYGKIPGCGDKPTLLLPGAQKLALAFQLSIEPEIEVHDMDNGHREYRCRCRLVSRSNGALIGIGVGNCNTMESKYRFRTQVTGEEVPKDYWKHRDPELLGGKQFSPKKVDGAWLICEKIDHDNPADYYNTCEKMAKKRAMVDGILTATGASDHFTQDIEDDPNLYGGKSVDSGAQNTASSASSGSGSTSMNDFCQFGKKHKGVAWSKVPNDYLTWIVGQSNANQATKDRAQEEMDYRVDGAHHEQASNESGGTIMAGEAQIRNIRDTAAGADITVQDLLEMFKLESMDEIRMCDVGPIIKWIADPASKPLLPAY